MAIDVIQLPADGAGKRIAARSYTENALTVYAQAGFLTTDTAGGNPAAVQNSAVVGSEYGLVTRPISIVDNAAFTDGTSNVFPAGYIFDETAGTSLTENDVGAARMDSKRAVVTVIEDSVNRGTRASVSSSLAQVSDPALTVRSISDNVATLFYDQIEGTAINTNLWTGSNTTMTMTQSAGFINLNAGAITTTTTHARIASVKTLPRFGYFPMIGRFACKVTNPTATNQNMEIGFAVAATSAAPTDGAFFRWTSSGLFAVVSFNSTETVSSALSGVTAGNVAVLEVHLVGRKAQFIIDGVLVATITATAANSGLTSVDRLPIHARVTNSGTASAAPQLQISRVTVLQSDLDWGKSWPDEISDSQAKGTYQSPVTTFAQTANWGNAAAPTTRTIANTTAGETTLGGLIAFTPTYTANNDYILFGYQVPAGYELHITSVTVGGPFFVSATTVPATVTLFFWGMAVGSSAVSLATADALGPPPTTWGPRRFALGATTQAASPTVATFPNPVMIQQSFPTPILCDAGRFVHIFVRTPIARAAGTAEIQYATASVNGYFE
jgi:hypothetical protein